mmetsp:Transcript_64797/g.173904  ORF Transcript_64797/g.173904 Transcript_64797/m.173904 type:complete len:117 (-) Transcript_64797:538-888(-)
MPRHFKPMTHPVQVLAAGSIPVYLGAPNWRELVPSPMAEGVVDAGRFDSPEELGVYLAALARDPVRLAEYHRWRERDLPREEAARLEATSYRWNLCRACRWWSRWPGRRKSARAGV